MRESSEHGAPRPIPRDWLPDPQPAEDTREWRDSLERVMAAADPALTRLEHRRASAGAGWSVIGFWWKPAAALAATAMALLVLIESPIVFPEPAPGSITLGLVASDGDPVTLWSAIGVQADPVLAWIAIHEPGRPGGRAILERENR